MTSLATPSPQHQILRDYQVRAIEDLRARIRAGKRSIVLVAPTGSGKTSIAGAMIQSAQGRGKRILFLAHRRELILQCSERLSDLGVAHGIIKADNPHRRPWLTVHVCSVPTLVNRQSVTAPDLIFIDECHRAAAPSYRKIIERYPRAVCIGLTATPERADGKGLSDLFDDMVLCPPPAELVGRGYLVPVRIFAPPGPGVDGVRVQHGDYRTDDLARVFDKPKLTGDVVQHWRQLASDRTTVVFAVNIEHSKHLAESFAAAGIACEHLDGEMEEARRGWILDRLAAGAIRVVCSVGVLTEGWDCPSVSCAVLARPTASVSLYLQMAGRIMRPHPGKVDALLLDHAGCVIEHGFPDEERDWTLDGVKRGSGGDQNPALSVRMCLQCWRAFSSSVRVCPHCGMVYEREIPMPDVVDGTLEEITEAKRAAYTIRKLSKNPQIAELQKIAEEKQYKPGWVFIEAKRRGLQFGGGA